VAKQRIKKREKAKNIAKIQQQNKKEYVQERISPRAVVPPIRLSAMGENGKKKEKLKLKDQKKKDERMGRARKDFSGHPFQRNVTKMLVTTASRKVATPVPLVSCVPADIEVL
jgi:hypothetical protein